MHAQLKEGEGVAEGTTPNYSQQMRKTVPISVHTL